MVPETDWDSLLEGIFDDVTEEFVSVKTMSLIQLQDELDEVDEKLGNLRQLMNPSTQEGRDLHSRRTAVALEIKLRLK